ncbi:MAG: FAD-dependent oxidoreductase, partial [Gammaproteobacteria bacterium]|nr:FAD-dependent oxidoreductase [Gammaproteobacteria bacterium]
MSDFDLIVLGGGSGGLATAQRAAEYGARAAVFEPKRLGGTCVNVGCVPKKVMWNAAEIAARIADAGDYGFDLRLAGHDFGALKRSRDAYVARLNGIYARNLDNKGIRHIASHGRLASADTVVDDAGRSYSAKHIVIATGGYPRWPSIEGADLGIVSDGFFDLESLPERVAVVGSGYVSVELAGVLRSLGSEVSVFLRKNSVLRSFDAMLSETLMAEMAASGIGIVTDAVPTRLSRDDGLTLETESAGSHRGFDALLWAIGRD